LHLPQEQHRIRLAGSGMMRIERKADRSWKARPDLDEVAHRRQHPGLRVLDRQANPARLATAVEFEDHLQQRIHPRFDRIFHPNRPLPDDRSRANLERAFDRDIEVAPGIGHHGRLRIERHVHIGFEMNRRDLDACCFGRAPVGVEGVQRILPLVVQHHLGVGESKGPDFGQRGCHPKLGIEPVRGATDEHPVLCTVSERCVR
jgi:hypothetical protein